MLNQDYQSALNHFKSQIKDGIKKPNFFILASDSLDQIQSDHYNTILTALQRNFPVIELSAVLNDQVYKCIVIDSGAPESIRDVLKKHLWPLQRKSSSQKSIAGILAKDQSTEARHFTLDDFGCFIPSVTRAFGEIRTLSLKHQWYYRYRVHYKRLADAPQNLQKFLENAFEHCPNHVFEDSKFSSSRCKKALPIPLTHHVSHEIIELAQQSKGYSELRAPHENLQKYFLDKDPCTLAVEVPLWIEAHEFNDYEDVFTTTESLTGHIDLVRINQTPSGPIIEIWDYKPNSKKEKYAVTQVFLYTFMLSIRTGLPLNFFSCGYFDEKDCYTYDPGLLTPSILENFK